MSESASNWYHDPNNQQHYENFLEPTQHQGTAGYKPPGWQPPPQHTRRGSKPDLYQSELWYSSTTSHGVVEDPHQSNKMGYSLASSSSQKQQPYTYTNPSFYSTNQLQSPFYLPGTPKSIIAQPLHSSSVLPRGEGALIRGDYSFSSSSLHYEEIDPSFFVRDRTFFCEGRVFAIIMNENAGSTATSYNSSISEVRYRGNLVYTQVRRFVVVRQKREFCYACPIFTYNGKGTLKRGVRPEEHGIAYSVGQKPTYVPGEKDIYKPSIAVQMSNSTQNLSVASRIYYGIIHPIQYNVKVQDVGMVVQTHIPFLIGNWRQEEDNEKKKDRNWEERHSKDSKWEEEDNEWKEDNSRKAWQHMEIMQNAGQLAEIWKNEGAAQVHDEKGNTEETGEQNLFVQRKSQEGKYDNKTEMKNIKLKKGWETLQENNVEEKMKGRVQEQPNDDDCARMEYGDSLEKSVREMSMISGPLNSTYERVRNPTAFYKKGRVFMTPWAEPGGFSEQPFVEIARFAVIKPHPSFSVCLRISTFSGQATTKAGLAAQTYAAVIPVGGSVTQHWKGEPLLKDPIEVKIEDSSISIHPMSRINFAKPYTVEHNIKIQNIGRVVGESVARLDTYFAQSLGHTKP